MAKIPTTLREHIDSAFPNHVCLVASVLPDGFAQVTPRGSTMVYDDEHLALWERGRGSTNSALHDGAPLTVFYRNPALRESLLPQGGVARFYGRAEVHKAGPVYDKVWEKLIQPEKDRDPEKKGHAVLIRIERVERLNGEPL